MREPLKALPSEIESLPDRPAVFLLWPESKRPYLAKTALLKRRVKRLARMPDFAGVVERIEYWPTGSQIESTLIHLELAKQYFPEEWQRLTRLKPPVFLKLTLENAFPRSVVTTRFGKGLHFGPFTTRVAAEKFEAGMLDLFQIRRCEENLEPSPEHPGCMYGEMNKCLRPCQQAVSQEEYHSEVLRVEQFLKTAGASLIVPAEAVRDRASADLDFEEAERMHARVTRIHEVIFAAGEVAREVSRLNGVAIVPSAEEGCVDLWFLLGGRWGIVRTVDLSETAGAGQSMDQRLRELTGTLEPEGRPDPWHMAVFLRWHDSSWRDGEWLALDSLAKIPYRKIVNAIGRVATGRMNGKPWVQSPA